MRNQLVYGAIVAASLLVLLRNAVAAEPPDELARRFSETARPLLKTHCFDCHAGEKAEAKLDLSTFASHRTVAEQPAVWRRIRQRLEAGEMPPEDSPQPLAAEERRQLIQWIKDAERFEVDH